MPAVSVRRPGPAHGFMQGRSALRPYYMHVCSTMSTSQQARSTTCNEEAASLQVKRIAALSHRNGQEVILAPAEGLVNGTGRQNWHLKLQGVPPFCRSSSPSVLQCARVVVDDLAVCTLFELE